MKSLCKFFGLVLLFSSLSYGASGGTISGTVKGPDGAPFKGAFVRAQNGKTKITMDVLTDRQGKYQMQNLAPGTYQVRVTAMGFKSDPRNNVQVDGTQPLSMDFALQKGMVRWSDISIHQGQLLLPEDPGKPVLFNRCESCHAFMTKIAGTRRDESGWINCVRLMQDPVGGVGDKRITDHDAAVVIPFLNKAFGIDAEIPESPEAIPGFEKSKIQFSDEAMKIVYVEYDMPGANRIPWNANPDDKGSIWMPFSKTAGGIARLDPETGDVQEWKAPKEKMRNIDIHSVVGTPDGNAWYTEAEACHLGKFNPKTQEFTNYSPKYCGGISVRMDRLGYVWQSAGALTRFDPKTEKFTYFPEVEGSYGLALDKEDNIWWAENLPRGVMGKVNINTLKVSIYTPPTTVRLAGLNKDAPDVIGKVVARPKTAGTKRIAVAPNGTIFFGEWWGGEDGQHGQIGSFDPKTETFKEYALPDADATPYGVGVDNNGYVWYNSYDGDTLGRLDPKTGKVVLFPFPHSDNGVREIRPDAQGRMWFGTPFNNKVGYFIPPPV